MTATAQNVTMYRGDTAILTVTVTDSDNGDAAKNITGATVRYVAVRRGTAYITKTVGSGIVLTTPASGILTITLDPADTDDLTPGEYEHEVEITDGDGNVSTVTVGTLTIRKDRA
jgi:hypothetical protein